MRLWAATDPRSLSGQQALIRAADRLGVARP